MVTEPTRVCKDCGERKPWSDFPRNGKGSLDSYCKRCKHVRRRVAYRERPETRAVQNRRAYERLMADPERAAIRREQRRRRDRVKFGTRPERYRVERLGGNTREMVPSAPFVRWFRSVMDREGLSVTRTSVRLGVSDKTMREVLRGRRSVDLATVERALIADDGLTRLDDLYPELYEAAC